MVGDSLTLFLYYKGFFKKNAESLGRKIKFERFFGQVTLKGTYDTLIPKPLYSKDSIEFIKLYAPKLN
jgi:hypothetical protein